MTTNKKSAPKSDAGQLPLSVTTTDLLKRMGVAQKDHSSGTLKVHSPIDGSEIGSVTVDTAKSLDVKIARAHAAFLDWRVVPAPKRGELIRLYGEVLRENKEDLGKLVTIECGK